MFTKIYFSDAKFSLSAVVGQYAIWKQHVPHLPHDRDFPFFITRWVQCVKDLLLKLTAVPVSLTATLHLSTNIIHGHWGNRFRPSNITGTQH